MNMKFNRKFSGLSFRQTSGMTLLDVLMGIVIFVVGMLALASLQGNLTRSTAEGNARTVGTNIAEELIEQLRIFDDLRATATCPTGLVASAAENVYQCITDGTGTVTRNGLTYTVTADINDWYFMPDRVTVTKNVGDLPSSRDTTISDFKHMDLTVTWAANDLLNNEGSTISASSLGAGSFTVSSIIPSIPQLGSAEIAAEDDGDLGTPPISYTPGQRPDIVAIRLTDDDRFKESTTPMPDVKRVDELVETWFDVITYNTLGVNDSIFLRREEFLAISCECTLKSASVGTASGFLPTVWNGEQYVTGIDGEMVSKTYGVSANNQQSQYCDTCCRDHHDTSSPINSETVYDPARLDNNKPNWSESGGLNGDHKHYTRANRGGLTVAGANDDYVEACRMVRKDGYMRVAQDFRQEGLHSFPEGYLDSVAGITEYSTYVTDAVLDFYNNDQDVLTPPSGFAIDFPADLISAAGAEDLTDSTTLPLLLADSQQMRSRGIYIDHLTSDVQDILNCLAAPDANPGCYVPEGVTNPLQVLPFYDIQTTWLAWWVSDPAGSPVSVTSEEVSDNNGHSRGLAVLENNSADERVEVETEIHRGNIGLTVTDPITLEDEDEPEAKAQHLLYVDVGAGSGGSGPVGYTWEGTFSSSVNQVDASSTTVTPIGNTFCSRSGTSISCITPFGENGGITISGYIRKQGQNYVDYWICPSGASGFTVVNYPAGINNSAEVTWPAGTTETTLVLSIETSICP